MKFYTVDVMIPTYKPGQEFAELLPRLLEQTYPIRSIRVVNTGKKFWNPAWEQLSDKIMVEHIRPSEFDHGGTRRAMAESSDADLLLFMTQDAMPYDNACVEHLVEKFSLPHVKAAYARQPISTKNSRRSSSALTTQFAQANLRPTTSSSLWM